MAFTGNSNYSGLAVFAIEQTLKRDWQAVWTTKHPFLQYLYMKGLNWNKGFGTNGFKALLAIMGDRPTNAADGVTDANEAVAMSYNATNGFGQAEYNFAHYRGNYIIKNSEARLAVQGKRGDILEGKKKQMILDFATTIATDASGTSADARDAILGIGYVLSTSNTVGGIAQGTDTQWAAQVQTGAGAFALSLIDDKIDAVRAEGRSMTDALLCSYSSSNNVYGKVRDAIAPAERLVNVDFKAKYGLDEIMYLKATVLMDNLQTAGEIRGLASDNWFAYVERTPEMHEKVKIPATDAYEVVGTAWAMLGCNDPAAQFRIAGIT